MPQRGALVIYGHAADLGNFKFFADDLATTELKSYGTNISIKNIQGRDDFFQLLRKPSLIIQELHIYTHAIGAGIYLGYGVEQFGIERGKTINQYIGKRTPYMEVLRTEQGGVLTDDLTRPPYSSYRDEIRKKF